MLKTFTFLFLQTPAIGLYTIPNKSIIRNHTVHCNHPSSSVSAKWALPLDISTLFHIHLYILHLMPHAQNVYIPVFTNPRYWTVP